MTGFALKLIAVLSMLLDHTGHILFPGQIWLRYAGRLAFPIYSFLLAEGFLHTKDLRKYMFRLLGFGIVSEIPFDLAFYDTVFTIEHQNVFWTLLLGLIAISVMSMIRFENIYLTYLFRILSVIPFALAAQFMHTDYRWVGVSVIACMYLFHDNEILRVASGTAFMLPFFTNEIEYVGALAFVPLHFYNGRRGIKGGITGRIFQIGFYLFYPVHLLVLTYIRYRLWT